MHGLGQTIADKGFQKGVIITLINLANKGLLSLANAAKEAGMTEEEFSELLKETEGAK